MFNPVPPRIHAKKQLNDAQKRADDTARQQQFQQDVEAQLAEIRKKDPAVRTVKDLLNRPYSQALYAAVKRGNNFLDAFYLATKDQETAQVQASAQQAAISKIRGKDHMKKTNFGGKAGVTVTEEEKKAFRIFNPNVTDEEIQAYLNKHKKG